MDRPQKNIVIPAQAGIHGCGTIIGIWFATHMDPGLRRDDDEESTEYARHKIHPR
jgi:hypothetical protein